MMSGNTGAAHFSLSERGDLAYVPGGADGGNRTLVWVDRSGKAEPLPLPPASYLYPRISPDGRSLAVEIEGPNHDFYFYDFARTVLSKVTTDGMSHDPVWSPDGRQVAFRSWQAGGMTMWLMPADRSAAPNGSIRQGRVRVRCRSPPMESSSPSTRRIRRRGMTSWSCRLAAIAHRCPWRSRDSWRGRGNSPRTDAGSRTRRLESGRPEIWVQAFPGPGLKLQVSNDGGTDPVWRRSGGELYYRTGNKMMAVTVVDLTGHSVRVRHDCCGRAPTRAERARRAECPGSRRPVTTCRPTASGF